MQQADTPLVLFMETSFVPWQQPAEGCEEEQDEEDEHYMIEGPEVDVYSAGVVLYEMVSFLPPLFIHHHLFCVTQTGNAHCDMMPGLYFCPAQGYTAVCSNSCKRSC